jgi:hypothetical protein
MIVPVCCEYHSSIQIYTEVWCFTTMYGISQPDDGTMASSWWITEQCLLLLGNVEKDLPSFASKEPTQPVTLNKS